MENVGDFSVEPEGGIEAFMESLSYTPADESELPPVDPDTLVATSIKLPERVRDQVKALAKQRGMGMSTLIAEWCELELQTRTGPVPREVMLRMMAEMQRAGLVA